MAVCFANPRGASVANVTHCLQARWCGTGRGQFCAMGHHVMELSRIHFLSRRWPRRRRSWGTCGGLCCARTSARCRTSSGPRLQLLFESLSVRAACAGRWGVRRGVRRRPRAAADALEVLFVKRTENPGDPWSGHVAFPGGRQVRRIAHVCVCVCVCVFVCVRACVCVCGLGTRRRSS